MKVLAIETATRCQSVALIDDDQVLAEETHPECTSHASVLIPAIDRILQSHNLSVSKLDGLAVSIGPGSFTGLRVGLSTMMGFRVATQLPLVTVPTLEAMAWNLKGEDGPICPIMNASRNEVYWAMFQWKGPQLIRLAEDRHGPLSQLIESIKEKMIFFGDGWLTHSSTLMIKLGKSAISGPDKAMHPSATSVAFSSLSSFHSRQYAGEGLAPRYIQRAEAEVQWEAKARTVSLE